MPPEIEISIPRETKPEHLFKMDANTLRQNLSERQLINAGNNSSSSSSTSSEERTPYVDINTGRARLTRQQLSAVCILTFVNLINYMDRYTVAGLLYDIGKAYNLSEGEKGLLQTAFILVYMIMAPIYGYLGDRFNRKLLMAIGVFIWSLTMLIGSFMPTYELFLLMRCFIGIGEASYSTIAPTVISDLFQGDLRSKMLALFYFAIPVGSGLGYIIGAEVSDLAQSLLPPSEADHAWRWGLRVTPAMGLVALLLIIFVLREPPRGECEGAGNMKATSFKDDLFYLFTNKSYMLITLAFTCVTYVAGALAWWAPSYVELAAKLQENPNVAPDNTSFAFGVVAMLAGIIGVPLGSFSGQKLRKKYSSGDAIICGLGIVLSLPLIIGTIFLASHNIILAFVVVLFGQIFLNLNWAVVSDMIMYVCIPTRRSSAGAFQILISHTFGDAGSPYIVGLVAEAFKPIVNASQPILPTNSSDIYIEYYSLQYSLSICSLIEIFAAIFFFWAACYVASDKEKCDRAIAEGDLASQGTTNLAQPTQRYADETDIEQTYHLINS